MNDNRHTPPCCHLGMKKCTNSLWIFLLCCLLAAPIISAHDDPNANVPSIRAVRADSPVTLDGVLDEPFWQEADAGTGFIEKRSQKPVKDQTFIRAAYNDEYLFIAVECMDEAVEEIVAVERRDDRVLRGDDHIEVHLDPFHDHRSEYVFSTNTVGTRLDSKTGAGGGSNTGWSADWETACKIYEDRWIVEIQIPFSAVNYFRRGDQTWGLNVFRELPRLESLTAWSFDRTDYTSVRHFGHLTGLNLDKTSFDRNWEWEPYVSTRYDFGGGDEELVTETGIDVSFRLTPSITTAWTLNPDFGEVESDADTIELRDTERFLPEQRPFFREGEELFGMPHMLYHSRRFTDIDTALKTTGKVGKTNFNFLDVYGDATRGDSFYGNSTVFRAVQELGEKSSVGYFVSNSDFDEGHSRVGSLDSLFYLTDNLTWQFQGSVADDQIDDKDGLELKNSTDYLGFTSVDYRNYPWIMSLSYDAVGEEFDPLLGYVPRSNIFGPTAWIQYGIEQDTGWYKFHSSTFQAQLYERENGETFIRDFQGSTEFEFHNNIAIQYSLDEEYRNPYDNWRGRLGFFIFTNDFWKVTDFFWSTGEYEEIEFQEFIFSRRIKLHERLPIRYTCTVRLEDDIPQDKERTVWLNQVIFDYHFTEDMWLKTSIQNQDHSKHNISVIYGWEFIKNADWYLVYNSVNKGEDTEQSVFTKVAYRF